MGYLSVSNQLVGLSSFKRVIFNYFFSQKSIHAHLTHCQILHTIHTFPKQEKISIQNRFPSFFHVYFQGVSPFLLLIFYV